MKTDEVLARFGFSTLEELARSCPGLAATLRQEEQPTEPEPIRARVASGGIVYDPAPPVRVVAKYPEE